jgi:hypothetical protein|eukprot:COSAG06_NODE_347_length_17007_cov_379.165306_7_plen_132_part_00
MTARLGTDTTYASQLDREGSRLFGERWGGVWARDTLPSVSQTRRGYIVNTDSSTGPGVHFIAVLDHAGRRFFSDPLGEAGRAQRVQLAALEPHPFSDDDPEMREDERTCGPLAMAAVGVGLAYGVDKFMTI